MKMSNSLYRKGLIVSIILLFIGASIVSGLNANISDNNEIQKLKSYEQIESQNNSMLSFHTFDTSETQQNELILSDDDAKYIFEMLEQLKYKIVYEPKTDETQMLKIEFVDLLDQHGLIPAGQTKDDILSLLNPSSLNARQNGNRLNLRSTLVKYILSHVLKNRYNLQQILKNLLGSKNPIIADYSPLLYSSGSEVGTATICNIASGGEGATLPLFVLPRPRIGAAWSADVAETVVGELRTGDGFVAGGAQSGIALGFIGLGLTYAFPGYVTYAFVGYATYTKVTADDIEFYPPPPPNNAPVISDENPQSESENIPISTSKLSFRISDADGDLMDYTVTTDPDIGSDNGFNKKSGIYSMDVDSLEYDMFYSWTVEVTDEKETTTSEFVFSTESVSFDPFEEGWQYRKQITIDHTKVDGNHIAFPALISTIDLDLRDKAQFDGDDILFMDDTGIAHQMYHEIEKYNGNNGNLVAWVKIFNLDNNIDTVFYMYYGNPSCENQQNPELLWKSNYVMVHHMVGIDNTIYDSTINHNDGTINGATWIDSGVIGKALDFDGNGDYVDCGASVVSHGGNAWKDFSVSAWIKKDQDQKYQAILSDYVVSSGASGTKGNFLFRISDSDTLEHHVWHQSGTNIRCYKSNEVIKIADGWIHLAAVSKNNGAEITLYKNGNSLGTGMISGNYGYPVTENTRMGKSVSYDFNGFIDEIRISNTDRSSSWISTEYNNQNDPSNFLSFGPEET